MIVTIVRLYPNSLIFFIRKITPIFSISRFVLKKQIRKNTLVERVTC